MKTFEAYVPVDLRVTLEARDEVVAGDKAGYVTDFFIKGASSYKLNLPGIGAVVLEIVPLEEDDDDTPEVFEVNRTETLGRLGSEIKADPYGEPYEGCSLIPKDHPSQDREVENIHRELSRANDTAYVPNFGPGGPLNPAEVATVYGIKAALVEEGLGG